MNSNSGESNQILSEFADDPDMSDLVKEYVGKMPQRMDQLSDAFEKNERDQLIRLAHQLKGSGGGYGFPVLTDTAGKLEQSLLQISDDDLKAAGTEFWALLDVCSKMAA
jgi:HPt (histidine-containing phosphotransfer) domain-containing protein